MFFSEKIPYAIFSFCNYFHDKTLAFLAQNISKVPLVLEGHIPPLFLACKKLFPGSSCTKKTNKNAKEFKCKSPFKFFIVEEVMLSSLTDFTWMNLNSKENVKVILFPLIQKFLKSFKLHSSFNHSSKQTNNLIIILTFQNL